MPGFRAALHRIINARGEGIEPSLKVLETSVLPLYEPRINAANRVLFGFLMHRMLPAMLAIFIHFQSAFEKLFILTGKIIDLLAFGALKFNHVVLRHKNLH